MDPGSKLLEQLKLVPNLVSEDPATITPTNSSFLDMPYSEFSKLLSERRRSSATTIASNESNSDLSTTSSQEQEDNGMLWDSQVGYQQNK
ncbi:hypothetical protein INT43_004755 [Umbelopsis isabellina]|uniref:Uncharacterized protein n=1 Tax=Mortierella isabellina TaxID=91625 RepID=A0A8H7PE27_MORIS|nr:hypothetical protein INT43_004755 [Umbelopsis isabellina]